MKIFSIQFAPLFMPFHRRLETLSAVTVIYLMTVSIFLALAITIILLCSPIFPVMVLYILWIIADRKVAEQGGRPNKWVQRWRLFRQARNYYPVSVTIAPECKLDPKKNYLACSFPHGLYPTGAFLAFAHDTPERRNIFSQHTLHTITLNIGFCVPFYRELILGLGFCNAKKESIDYLLNTSKGGKVVTIMVGGASESEYAFGGKYCLVLKNRKGFVKLALKNGTSLIPVFSFGETSLFNNITFPENSIMRKFQVWVKRKTGVALNVISGRGFFQYTFGFVPFRHPINVVVGKPINVEKKDSPTQQDIDTLHKIFVDALTNLFEEYKYRFEENPEETSLIII